MTCTSIPLDTLDFTDVGSLKNWNFIFYILGYVLKNQVIVLVCCMFVSSNVVVDYRFLFSEPLIPGFGTQIIFVPIFGTCIFFVPVFGTCTTFFPTFGTHFRLSELFVPKIGTNRYLGSETRKNPPQRLLRVAKNVINHAAKMKQIFHEIFFNFFGDNPPRDHVRGHWLQHRDLNQFQA